MTLIIVNDVACPYCNAEAGRPCRVAKTGRLLPYPHKQRRLAFRIQRASRSAA